MWEGQEASETSRRNEMNEHENGMKIKGDVGGDIETQYVGSPKKCPGELSGIIATSVHGFYRRFERSTDA
ncbi:hypothetical protein PoB_002703900 [Plakobranchus ocellatus]|uniref:Uncharacterized protein n=1 Tax=Plakobranchus ocellatus TaxID=259542 RepID=A0AAV4A1R8_9GAST|nr:hypothetical protein PoB_002703900 [Plakobranchus ocellatus]